MKQTYNDKYSIAWFNLAQAIARREKERVFGMYRLLSHSLDNTALALQLEGDILRVFAMDDEAEQKYKRSAEFYQKQGDLLQAVALYYHLFTFAKNAELYFDLLINLHLSAKKYDRCKQLFEKIAEMPDLASNIKQMNKAMQRIKEIQVDEKQEILLSTLFYSFAYNAQPINEQNKTFLFQILDVLTNGFHQSPLQEFLLRLQHEHPTWYAVAIKYLDPKQL
jgi:hypothetical protein